MEKQKLVIFGVGSFAPEVVDLADETGAYEVVAFVDSRKSNEARQFLLDRPIVSMEEAAKRFSSCLAVCALGTTRRRELIELAVQKGFAFATIVHPAAQVSRRSTVGSGSIISAGVVVASHTAIGRHVLLNRGCLIGHHVTIGDYVTVSPGANIAASVAIGEGAYVGMGAIVLDHLRIGARSVIGAGAVVTRDVPECVQVMGVPAKIVKENVMGL